NHLALSIYRQAEVARKHKDIPTATSHFLRITDITPESDIAPTGLYDAIALFMSNKLWNKAISAMKKFQHLYPAHKLSHNITKNLSRAYLNSDQNLKAAREFERLATSGSDKNLKKTALLQAAELYEEKGNYPAAIRSYGKYVSNYKKPFSQYMESMYKLLKLNEITHASKKASYWRKSIINADSRTYKKNKTARTKFITSTAIISLAREKDRRYRALKLIRPLKRNLRRKKKEMQRAVQLYGKASVYKISEVSTEATYAIASIYNDFSKALLKAELPRNLNKDEREQYMILLEDMAFPFEEKAIEFYELNMEHTRNNNYNNWIKKSLANLKVLFPVRYNRKLKIDRYINVLH
ncbi:TPR domain protein, putative component of TonB system, partial [hydrothermal vent metagenome]